MKLHDDPVAIPSSGDKTTGRCSRHPLWIRAAVDAESFAEEQRALGKLWSFVGLSSDIPNDGDWFRTIVAGRSIFVQRFDTELRAFENRCAHRFYPLRVKERGNGPIVCGFHHWRYNKDGQAVGIPHCPELFGGAIPRDLGLSIPRLEVQCCGELIFVRFAGAESVETLEEFLGAGFPILSAVVSPKHPPQRLQTEIKAYWKFAHHISLDDYHIVAVHPTSFGRNGYLKPETVKYHRFGRHSAYSRSPKEDLLTAITADLAEGTYRPENYTIFNIFPNFLVSLFHATRLFGKRHWYVSVIRYVALSHERTEVQMWVIEAPFPQPETWLSKLLEAGTDRMLPPIVAYYAKKILSEDNHICEGQQLVAAQVRGEQVLSAQEERIGWFEEAYRQALGASSTS